MNFRRILYLVTDLACLYIGEVHAVMDRVPMFPTDHNVINSRAVSQRFGQPLINLTILSLDMSYLFLRFLENMSCGDC